MAGSYKTESSKPSSGVLFLQSFQSRLLIAECISIVLTRISGSDIASMNIVAVSKDERRGPTHKPENYAPVAEENKSRSF